MNLIELFGFVIAPNRCVGCGCIIKNCQYSCSKCSDELNKAKSIRPKAITYRARRYLISGLFKYDSVAGYSIKRLKFSSDLSRVKGIAYLMSQKLIRKRIKNIDYITYVPMTSKKMSDRGFCQTEEIARVMAKLTNIKFKRLLKKKFETESQINLSGKERKENLYDAFKVSYYVKGKIIVIIDDVCTTGSTLCECAKTLYDNGAKKVVLMAFALT